MAQTKQPDFWVDALSSFEEGMNMGEDSRLLPNSQLSFAGNTTVRGTLAHPRPAFSQINLQFPSNSIQAAFQLGYYQVAGIYRPDFANPGIVVAISGRLFLITIQSSGSTFPVTEVSIAGDLSNTTGQMWIWQSENYMIINDGFKLPIFYNGTTTRRSFGTTPSVLGSIIGDTNTPMNQGFTIPEQGSVVAVQLSAPYTGPVNTNVVLETVGGLPFGGPDSFWQVVGAVAPSSASYSAQLTVLYTPLSATATLAAGTLLQTNPNVFGYLTNSPIATVGSGGGSTSITCVVAGWTGSVGSQFTLNGQFGTATLTCTGITAGGTLQSTTITASGSFPATEQFNYSQYLIRTGAPQNPTLVGTVQTGVPIPGTGANLTVALTAPYNGPANQVVYGPASTTPGGQPFAIAALISVLPANQIYLVNISSPLTIPNLIPGAPGSPAAATTSVISTTAGPVNIVSIPELPPGRMGTYGLGRNWMALTDGQSFIASDIVGGPSGSQANNFRDAPLKITENTFLAGGGAFRVPSSSYGDIRAMRFTATLDAELGQGPLQVLTPVGVFSCNAPVDRTTWASVTNPILTESLIGNGGLAQNSSINFNSDIWFRAIDGLRSLILARRQFAGHGNVSNSFEVDPILSADNQSLLNWGSTIDFQNRLVTTAGPTSSTQGVYHTSLIALNADPITSLTGKTNEIYDGQWTGLNFFQVLNGIVFGVQRSFAFVLGNDGIELWEILPDPIFQNGNFISGVLTDMPVSGALPIVMDIQSATILDKDVRGKTNTDFCRLKAGEIAVDQIMGPIRFQAYYKPDQYPTWVPWHSWSLNTNLQPGQAPFTFHPRMGLGEPDPTQCDPILNRPLREAFTFQFRLVVTGYCRVLSARFLAEPLPIPLFAPPICS